MNSVLYLKKLNAFNSYFDCKVISNDFSTAFKTVQSFKNHLQINDALIETHLESIVECLNNYMLFSVYHYMSLDNICDFDAKSTLKDNVTLLTDLIDPSINKELHLKYVHAITSRLLEVVLDPSIWCVCSKELLKIFLKLIRPYESDKQCRILEKSIILYELVDKLFTCGEYNYQTILLQVIVKLMDPDHIKHQVTIFFPEREDYQRLFQAINSHNYHSHVRTFLNTVNASNLKVVSIAAEEAWLDTLQLTPAKEFQEDLDVFWVDFNTLEYNKSISFQSAKRGVDKDFISSSLDSIENTRDSEKFVICIQHLQQVSVTTTRTDQTKNENKVVITLRLGKGLQCEYGNVPNYIDIKNVSFKLDNSPEIHKIISTVFPELFGNKFKDETKMFLTVLPKMKSKNMSEVTSETLYKISTPINYKSLNFRSPLSRNKSLCQSWLSSPTTSGNKTNDLRSVNPIISSTELPLSETLLQLQSRLSINEERDKNAEQSRPNQKQCYTGCIPNRVKRSIHNLFDLKRGRSVCSSLGSLGSIEEEPEFLNLTPVKRSLILKPPNATFTEKAPVQKQILPSANKNRFLLKRCTNSIADNNVRNSKLYKQSTSRGFFLKSLSNKENFVNKKRYLSAKIYNPKGILKGKIKSFENTSKVNNLEINTNTNAVSQRKKCKITIKSVYKLSKEVNENVVDCIQKDNTTIIKEPENVESKDEDVAISELPKQNHFIFIGLENNVEKLQLVENITTANNGVTLISEQINKTIEETPICTEQSEYKENENLSNTNKDLTECNNDEIINHILDNERITEDPKIVSEMDGQLLNIETEPLTLNKIPISKLEMPQEVKRKKSKKDARIKKRIFKRKHDKKNSNLQTVHDIIEPTLNDAVVSLCNHYSQDVQENINSLLYDNAKMVEQENHMSHIASITEVPTVETAKQVVLLDRLSSPKAKSTPLTTKRPSLREAILNYTNIAKQFDNQSVHRKSDCGSIKSTKSRKLFNPDDWSYTKPQISNASSICTGNEHGDRIVDVTSPQIEANVIKENLAKAKDRGKSTYERKNVPILLKKRNTAIKKAKRSISVSKLVVMGEICQLNKAFDKLINEVVQNRYEKSGELRKRKCADNKSASRDKRKKLTDCFIPLNELRKCVDESGFCIFSCDATEISSKIKNCSNSQSPTEAATISAMDYIGQLSKTLKQNIEALTTIGSAEEICLSESYLSIHKYYHTNQFSQSKNILP